MLFPPLLEPFESFESVSFADSEFLEPSLDFELDDFALSVLLALSVVCCWPTMGVPSPAVGVARHHQHTPLSFLDWTGSAYLLVASLV